MEELRANALVLGADDLQLSPNKGKRFYVIFKGKKIHFGSKNGETFIDHGDEKKRRDWYARHSKILLKDKTRAIDNKHSPAFWSAKLLW